MDARNIPAYYQLYNMFQSQDIETIHFTKSLKYANIYKLCLWILEDDSCLISTN